MFSICFYRIQKLMKILLNITNKLWSELTVNDTNANRGLGSNNNILKFIIESSP